jgi:hypothetical protein
MDGPDLLAVSVHDLGPGGVRGQAQDLVRVRRVRLLRTIVHVTIKEI